MEKIIYCVIAFVVWTGIVVWATSLYNNRSFSIQLDVANQRYYRLDEQYNALIKQRRIESDATGTKQQYIIREQQDTILRQSATIEGQFITLQQQSGIINELKDGTRSLRCENELVGQRAREILEIISQLPTTS